MNFNTSPEQGSTNQLNMGTPILREATSIGIGAEPPYQ